ncbi:hypothetical protein BH09BAC1_BH09BAC1_04240 [soil metagenome]
MYLPTPIANEVEAYVTAFMKNLPEGLHFHNLAHTQEVAAAAVEIGTYLQLTDAEMEIVHIAAWFHDCGYCITYMGHEHEGALIAEKFLRAKGYGDDKIAQVVACINATRFPQKPQTLVEEVICDADLYHFSRSDYNLHQAALRNEWNLIFEKQYTDEEWDRMNYEMIQRHSYFTAYGKEVLEVWKHANLQLLKNRLGE